MFYTHRLQITLFMKVSLEYLCISDRAMQLDKKHMPEYVGTMEATIEIQSLQIVGFLSMVSVYIIRLLISENKIRLNVLDLTM